MRRVHVHGSFERDQPLQTRPQPARYLFLDDVGRAYESAGRNEFREIPFDEALARVEEPLKELGETLETAYDDAYISRKESGV